MERMRREVKKWKMKMKKYSRSRERKKSNTDSIKYTPRNEKEKKMTLLINNKNFIS